MATNFQRIYNELKKRSFDIVIRISDLEGALGTDNSKVMKLKKSFSKLQSSVNYALYYKNNGNLAEAQSHIDYAYKMSDYLYKVLESVEIPKAEVKFEIPTKEEKKKSKGPRFRIKLNRKMLKWMVLIALIYSFIMYWFFIR